MSLRLLPLLLVLAACKPATDTGRPPAVGQLGSDLTLLDDFSEGAIDGVWRWGDADTSSRTVDAGAAVLSFATSDALVPGSRYASNGLATPAGVDHTEIGATFTLDDIASLGGDDELGVLLRYDYAAGGNPTSLYAALGFHAALSSAPILVTNIYTCSSGSCQSVQGTTDFAHFPAGWPVDPSVPHTLSVRYDAGANQFAFGFDGQDGTADASQIDGFDGSGFYDAEIYASGQGTDPQAYEAGAKVHVSQVEVDGSPYGAFTGSHLDLSRWQQGDEVRQVDNGELVLASGASTAGTAMRLPLRDFSGVNEVAATVRVDEYTWDGTDPDTAPFAGIGGVWYDEGTGGDGSGGAAGQVYASIGVSGGTDVQWLVARCNNSDCSDQTVLGRASMGSLDLGTAETLYLGWNGTWFTFQRGTQDPATFDPLTAGSTPAGPPTAGVKDLEVSYPWGASGTGYVRAAFDDVMTNATGQVALSVGGTPDGWTTAAAAGSNLASLVCLGADPADPGLVLLHAVRGASNGTTCDGSDCAMLDLSVPSDVDWTAGVLSASARLWDPSSGAWKQGSGSIVFDQNHAPGQRVSGRFNGTLDDGTAVQAAFDAPWLPAATAPARAGSTEAAPKGLDASCLDDPLRCQNAASTGRTTWYSFPTTPGEARALRAWGGDAKATLYDADDTALCSVASTTDTPSGECTGSASGDQMLVEIAGKGGASAIVGFAVSEPFTDLQPGQEAKGAIPAGGHRWYRVRTASTGQAWLLLDHPHDTTSASVMLYDRLGQLILSNGYCCTGSQALQEYFVPVGRGDGEMWFRVDSHGTAHTYDVVVQPSGTGATAPDPIPQVVDQGNDALNFVLGANQSLWTSFTTGNGGAYRIYADGLGSEGTPHIDWALSTDPSDPAHTLVQTDSGTSCAGSFVDADNRYEADCWVLLDANTTYYLQLTEQDGVAGSLADVHIDVPPTDETVVSADVRFAASLSPGVTSDFVAWTTPGKGYNLTMPGSIESATFLDMQGNVLRSMTTSAGDTFGMPLPGSEVQAFTHFQLYDYGTQFLGLPVTLESHSTGDEATSPIEIPLLTEPFVEDDTLAAYAARYFQIQAPQAGTYPIDLTDGVANGSYGTVSPLSWDLFTDPNNPGGSLVWQCSSSPNPNDSTRFDTVCSPNLQSGTAYYLKVSETLGNQGVHYQLVGPQ